MVCVLALILCISLRFGSTHSRAEEIIGSQSYDSQVQLFKEKLQRIDHEHLRKAKLDKFVIEKRKTFVVTPAFDMDLKTNKISTPIEPVIRFTEILDAGVVRNELSTEKHENNIAIGKVGGATETGVYDVASGLHGAIRPLGYKNIQTVESPQVPMINVLEKQNEMIEKLVALYQEELKRNRIKKKLMRNSKNLRQEADSPIQSNETNAAINNEENIMDTALKASNEIVQEINAKTTNEGSLLQDVTEGDAEEHEPTEPPEKEKDKTEDGKENEPDDENKQSEEKKPDDENKQSEEKKPDDENKNNKENDDENKNNKENDDENKNNKENDDENKNNKENDDENKNNKENDDENKNNKENDDENKPDEEKDKNTTTTETVTTTTARTTTRTRKRLIYTFDRIEIIKALRENPWLSDIVHKANEDKLEYFRKLESEQKIQQVRW